MNLGKTCITNNTNNISQVRIVIDKTINNYTIGGQDYTDLATGFLTAMPVINLKDVDKYYKGHIAYYHPTIFNKQVVPSNFDINSTIGKSYRSIIAFWCSMGYSITFYDGVGLGMNYFMIHPYVLLPWANIQNMYFILNMVLAILQGFYYGNQRAYITLYAIGYS